MTTHDKRMTVALIAGIAIAVAMPFPINIIQVFICGLSIAWRVPRMLK